MAEKKPSVWLPEESFQSWGNYGRAMADTPHRLRNRMFSRAVVSEEVTKMRARSGTDMKKNLNWWDLMWFGIGATVGAGIFVLTGQEANSAAGPSIILSYCLAGFSAMLSVFCYVEFAVEVPVAGMYGARPLTCFRLSRNFTLYTPFLDVFASNPA